MDKKLSNANTTVQIHDNFRLFCKGAIKNGLFYFIDK